MNKSSQYTLIIPHRAIQLTTTAHYLKKKKKNVFKKIQKTKQNPHTESKQTSKACKLIKN